MFYLQLKASLAKALPVASPAPEDIDDLVGRLEASEDIRIEVCSRLAEAEARLSEAEERVHDAEGNSREEKAQSMLLTAKLAEVEATLADKESLMTSRVGTLSQQVCVHFEIMLIGSPGFCEHDPSRLSLGL